MPPFEPDFNSRYSSCQRARTSSSIQTGCLVSPANLAEKESTIAALINELGAYLACTSELSGPIDILGWWRRRRVQPSPPVARHALACTVALFQPSSAGVERIFSMLQHQFNDQQSRALEDYRRTALMVRFNETQRRSLALARATAREQPESSQRVALQLRS